MDQTDEFAASLLIVRQAASVEIFDETIKTCKNRILSAAH